MIQRQETVRNSLRIVIVLFAVLICLPRHLWADAAADAALVKGMFERMNLDYPGLENVKAAWEKDDLHAAEAAYLEFWRHRDDHVILWNTLFRNFDRRMRTSGASDFFTQPSPVTISWRDREQLKSRIKLDDIWANDKYPSEWTALEMADMLLEDKLTLIRMSSPHSGKIWFIEPTEMGAKWDWNFWLHENPYTNGFLHRCYWMPVLAQVYWSTGEEKYAQKLIELWVDWVRSPPMSRGGDSGKNGGLGPMYQASLQPSCLEMILQSPHLKPRDFCLMAGYVTGGPINSMTGGLRGGNQTIGQAKAIFAVAGAFPEFKKHAHWVSMIQKCLDNYCTGWIYPDGGFAETTFLYSAGTALGLLSAVESAQAIADVGMNLKVPEEAKNPELWGDYFLFSSRPDWYLPWTGHGGRVKATKLMEHLAIRYPERKDFLFYATEGKEGQPPKSPSHYFNWAGYTAMRDKYGPKANFLFFDAGPCGAFHRNADKLMVIVASHGRTLIEDRGIHTYTPHKPEFHTYFQFSYGHSTVVVDRKSQRDDAELPKQALDCPWASNDTLDYNAAEYRRGYIKTAYATGETDAGVSHHRSVVFVKPDYWIVTDRMVPTVPNQSLHLRTFEQLWQYIPCRMEKDEETLSVTSATPDEPYLALIPVKHEPEGLELEIAEGRREPYILGWAASGDDDLVRPAPTVIYRKQSAIPAILQTVLWPNDKGETGLPQVEPIAGAPGGCVKVTLPDGRVDLHYSASEPCKFELGGSRFHALAALVRLDAQGHIVAKEAVKP